MKTKFFILTLSVFFMTDKLVNIGTDFRITGNILPDMDLGNALSEDWRYTVFATHDPSIIPEPGTFALVLVGLIATLTFYRKKTN